MKIISVKVSQAEAYVHINSIVYLALAFGNNAYPVGAIVGVGVGVGVEVGVALPDDVGVGVGVVLPVKSHTWALLNSISVGTLSS